MAKQKLEVSPILQKKIDEVTQGGRTPVLYDISFLIVSATQKDIRFEVSRLERIDIVMDFETQFMDFIDADFLITKQQYIQIMKHSEDLQCVVKFYEYDVTGGKRGALKVTEQYMLVLRDKQDLYKIFPDSQIQANETEFDQADKAEQRIGVSAQLIKPTEYNMIKIGVNVVLRNVTMAQVINYLCSQFKIPKLRLVKPDNTKVYDNFIIPPMKKLIEVFTWLQYDDGKGVYDKGLSYYVRNETLFVYPKYETNFKSKRCVHFYKIPNAVESDVSLVGYKDGNLHVLIKDPIANNDMTDIMIENQGNALIIQHLDKIIEDSYNTPEGFKYNVFETNTTMEILESKKGVISDVYNPNFRTSAENVHKIRSEIANNELVYASIHTNHLHYNNFKPADRVEYHYDGDGGVFQTKTGQITRLVTHIVRPTSEARVDLFTMDNEISLIMNNDISNVKTPVTITVDDPSSLITQT